MLILSRKINEKLQIGDQITITIIEVKGDQVKLGIEAPSDVKVFRRELYDAIQEQNKLAAASGGIQLPSIDIAHKK
ncbi:MAG TPA: carbon storage regulator CsrA [Spirochaetia bacterium]|nr:carbon storage regulator CsrA [Spirochaetales bacterium]HRS64772.1 carbon storage regulator CsrA [Spirochaetia bacterium]HPD79454.1 carbon storage regulator CsrA [Spirochaetales bacterium]HQG39269.1 carbon storage regulator CsrA [Spirochaetales bacterium]HQK33137.1 carbon storage regulator CsrA [Spirochaetales bacterium]